MPIPLLIYYWYGKVLFRNAFPNSQGQPGLAKGPACCCGGLGCCGCDQFNFGADPETLNDLNVTISGAFTGTGTIEPTGGAECVEYIGTVQPSNGDCDIVAIDLDLVCPI